MNIRENCVVSDSDMPREEYQKRLVEAEYRAAKAEKENRLLKECIVRMALGRWGVLSPIWIGAIIVLLLITICVIAVSRDGK